VANVERETGERGMRNREERKERPKK